MIREHIQAFDRFAREQWEGLLLVLLVLSVFNFTYLYFFEFDEGRSSVPGFVMGLKDAIIWLVLGFILWAYRHDTRLSLAAASFFPFAIVGMVVYILDPSFDSLRGNIVRVLPGMVLFAFLAMHARPRFLERAARLILVLGLIQVVIAFVLKVFDVELWNLELFVGTIGNPNSFALFLNLGIAVLLPNLMSRPARQQFWSIVAYAVLVFGILGTASLSQTMVLIGLLFLVAVFEVVHMKRVPWRTCVLVAVGWGLSKLEILSLPILTVKFTLATVLRAVFALVGVTLPIDDWFGLPEYFRGRSSISLTGRIEMHQTAWAVITRDIPSFLLGDLANPGYHRLDGMHIQLLANGGVVWFLSFAVPCAYLVFLVLRVRRMEDMVYPLLMACMVATLFASRVLQYFPFDLLFFLVAAGVLRTLPLAQAHRAPASDAADSSLESPAPAAAGHRRR